MSGFCPLFGIKCGKLKDVLANNNNESLLYLHLPLLTPRVLIVEGDSKAGKTTLCESLHALLLNSDKPVLWVDASREHSLSERLLPIAHEGLCVETFLLALNEQPPPISVGAWADHAVSELPQPLEGNHELVTLFSKTNTPPNGTADLPVVSLWVQEGWQYGWRRLFEREYACVVMDGYHPGLIEGLPPDSLTFLYVGTPNTTWRHLSERVTKTVHGYVPDMTGGVFLNQLPHPDSPLPTSLREGLSVLASMNWLGKLPFFSTDKEWEMVFLPALLTSMQRLAWAGAPLLKL
jgi:hypothetical protein